jgi:Flp pilus assembly pilin Flp
MFKKHFRRLGQGMTEYIIIVALIAIAAIAVYGLFGDTIKGQMGVMTEELAGTKGNRAAINKAKGAVKGATAAGTLGDYEKTSK